VQPLRPGDPDRVGDYRLLGRLGSGGMGVVYLGCSPGGRMVAVKTMLEGVARDARYRARFRREVAAARTVTGAFTAPLLEADPEAETPWLVTDYLPGLSLREAVGAFGGLPPDTVRLLAAALAEALVGIHRAGLAHRDLKPENILLTADGPRVIDFGIARLEDATAITVPGAALGTPGFMSPEQASGGAAGPAGDMFSLGAVLAFAATGQEPFRAGDRAATLERVRQARPDLGGLTDRALRALVMDCLRREPARRLSAAALLDRLGEPAVSVRGTRWLPASLAEAIDQRVARPGFLPYTATSVGAAAVFGVPEQGAARPDDPTADPAAATAAPPGGPGVTPPRTPGARGPDRRRLLLTAVAVPVAAGAAGVLGRKALPAGDGAAPSSASPSPSSSLSPSADSTPPATAPPPRAATRWRTKVMRLDQAFGRPTLYRAGGAVLAAHSGDEKVRAVDPRTGKVMWSRPADDGLTGRATVGPDTVYVVDPREGDVSVLRAVEPDSGDTRWTYRPPFSDFVWGLAATGSLVYAITGGGIRAMDAKDGRPRWTVPSRAMTITAGRDLVVTVDERLLTALDARSGRTRWTHKAKDPVHYPLIGDGMVFYRDTFGTLFAIRADDGKPAWHTFIDYRSSVRRSGGGLLYVDHVDGDVRALRTGTGTRVWSRRVGEPTTLGLSDGTLWVGGSDRTVYALDAVDGRVLWTYGADATGSTGGAESGAGAGSGALAVAGLVLIGSWNGHVEAVSPPALPNGGPRASS
jgi:outer membrane protein assembly factor BamB